MRERKRPGNCLNFLKNLYTCIWQRFSLFYLNLHLQMLTLPWRPRKAVKTKINKAIFFNMEKSKVLTLLWPPVSEGSSAVTLGVTQLCFTSLQICYILDKVAFLFFKDFIFKAVLGLQENWEVQRFLICPSPDLYIACPTQHPHQNGTFYTKDEPTLTHRKDQSL